MEPIKIFYKCSNCGHKESVLISRGMVPTSEKKCPECKRFTLNVYNPSYMERMTDEVDL